MAENKIKVFVSGNFNILHPGHQRLFRFARECGDYLIVAVLSDRLAGSGAHVPEQLRFEGVSSNNWIDKVFLIDEKVSEFILRLKPDIVVKGREYQSTFNPEQAAVDSYGGKLLFDSGEATFSSIELLRKEFYQSSMDDIRLPQDYMDRQNISINGLINLVNKFSKVKVCVIGDLIVDEYITCEALGMSQEDPTIVVTPVDKTKFIGGAAIVASHAAGLGAEVEFISITGNDEGQEFVGNKLMESGVNSFLVVDNGRPTTLKQRFRSKGKSLLRVSHLHQSAISQHLQDSIFDRVKSIVNKIDLIVFSDFNYGCLPQELVEKIISLAKSHDVTLTADSQSSSQIGDISRFKGMDLITPTEREARISARNNEDGLVVLAENLRELSLAKNVVLKMSEEGLLIHAGCDNKWLTDRIGALNSAAKDVAGAGDSLLISSSLALASGGSIWSAAVIGSLAAAIQVGRVGNVQLSADELMYELSL